MPIGSSDGNHYETELDYSTGNNIPPEAPQSPAGALKSTEGTQTPSSFDTKLNRQEEEQFQAWKNKYNLSDSNDYDTRGAFLRGLVPSENGHLPDTFKLPNHITFSNESMYSSPEHQGGIWKDLGNDKWSFTPSEFNLKNHSAQELQDYFKQYEPDSTLILPDK